MISELMALFWGGRQVLAVRREPFSQSSASLKNCEGKMSSTATLFFPFTITSGSPRNNQPPTAQFRPIFVCQPFDLQLSSSQIVLVLSLCLSLPFCPLSSRWKSSCLWEVYENLCYLSASICHFIKTKVLRCQTAIAEADSQKFSSFCFLSRYIS